MNNSKKKISWSIHNQQRRKCCKKIWTMEMHNFNLKVLFFRYFELKKLSSFSWSQVVTHNNPQLLVSQLHNLKKMLHFNMSPTKSHAYIYGTTFRTFTPSNNGILLITLRGETRVMHKEEKVEKRRCIKQRRWKKLATLNVTITFICELPPCNVAYWQTPPLGYTLIGNIKIYTITFVGNGS